MLNTMIQPRTWLAAFLCLVVMAWTGVATAQLPAPDAASQFNIDGFLQEATLDNPADPLSGGTMKVNGHTIIVPANTIVILPANAMTWQELFACAPPPYGNGYSSLSPLTCGALLATPQTGMALADLPAPLTTYDVSVTGNKAPGSAGAADRYIAGVIEIAQQGLNSGQGYITNIVYGTAAAPDAELQIANPLDPTMPFVRVKINDPATVPVISGGGGAGQFTGRYSVGLSPDPRFTVDQDNPTIASETGFPMCVPRIAPGGATADDLCPQGNRPTCLQGDGSTPFCGTFTMPNPANISSGGLPDPRVQAPFEIGDYITFAGTLVKDAPAGGFLAGDGPTAGPWPAAGAAATYISAHTIDNNIAIYTFPNTNPAYITTGVFILGTGGAQILGAVEATKRTRFEGMMTDPSRMVHLYGMDLPCTGAAGAVFGGCDRDWGIIGVDQGPPTGAVKGRWRFRPPCAPFGTDPATIKFDKECIMNAAGTFLPATREMRSVIEPLPGSGALFAWSVGQTTPFANGIIAGQYHAPILEYLFPEQLPGTPVPPANFETMPFLAVGGYTSSLGTTAPGPLTPWPGSSAPCGAAPTAVAFANPSTVFSGLGALVTLDASTSTGGSLSFLWTQAATDTVNVLPAPVASATATFTAPTVAAATTLNFTVTVTNCAGTSSAAVTVNVVVDVPLVNHVPPVTVVSGTPGVQTIPISGVDPNSLALTFNATQSGGAPALGNFTVVNPNPLGNTANITFTVPTLPLGQVTSDVVQLAITATNTASAVSPTEFTTVTVNPQPDIVTVTAAQYRISKQRLTINASDSVISPNIVLTLQPYACQGGPSVTCPNGIFTPPAAQANFAPAGTGLYLLDVLGFPQPACNPPNPGGAFATPCSQAPMSIKTNIPGGGSVPFFFGLTSIRQ